MRGNYNEGEKDTRRLHYQALALHYQALSLNDLAFTLSPLATRRLHSLLALTLALPGVLTEPPGACTELDKSFIQFYPKWIKILSTFIQILSKLDKTFIQFYPIWIKLISTFIQKWITPEQDIYIYISYPRGIHVNTDTHGYTELVVCCCNRGTLRHNNKIVTSLWELNEIGCVFIAPDSTEIN